MIGAKGCMIRWQGTLTEVGKCALKSWLLLKIHPGKISDMQSRSAKMRQKCPAFCEENDSEAKIASKSANSLNWPEVCYYETVLSLIRSDKHAVVIGRTDFAW